jgi:methyltransferase-like protein
MSDEWVKIFGAAQTFIIEMLKGMLEENGIKSVMVNKTDSMHLHLSNADVELYVQKEDVIRAKRLIEKNQFE